MTHNHNSTNQRKQNNQKQTSPKKFCLCRQPERHPMIGCDYCDEWYHNTCLNLSKEDVKGMKISKALQ